MPFNVKRLPPALAAIAMLSVPAVALADTLTPDADTLIAATQSTRNLGLQDPGAVVSASASFVLKCQGVQHLNSGQSANVALRTDLSTIPTGGAATADPTPVSIARPSTWGADGSACAAGAADQTGTTALSLTAPKSPGSTTYTLKWDPTVSPAHTSDGSLHPSLDALMTLTYTMEVRNVAPAITEFTGAAAAKVGETKSYTFTATDANATTPTKALDVSGPNGAALDTGAVDVDNADLKVTFNQTGTFEVRGVASDGVNAATKSAPITVTVSPADSTPPVIAADVQGTQGDNGWYTGNATVSFSVVDEESTVSSTSAGCAGGTVSSDTSGTTFTCSATSAGGSASESVTVKRDATAPVITRRTAGDSCATPGNNGWCRGEQAAGFSASDTTSGLVDAGNSAIASPYEFTQSTTTNGDAVQISSGTVKDAAGNEASAITAGPFEIDDTNPTLNPSVTPSPVYLNGSATASANAADATSLIASATCDRVDTSVAGKNRTVACTATDNAGNSNTANATYDVLYKFNGFFQPVDAKTLNGMKAGSTAPIKFQLRDANDLPVSSLAAVSKASSGVMSCAATMVEDTLEEYATGATQLRYDATTNQFIYNWQSPKQPGKCYRVIVSFADGTTQSATFTLR